ncbi:hypothetical protein LguiA_033951 [Lonicera macranthoides]
MQIYYSDQEEEFSDDSYSAFDFTDNSKENPEYPMCSSLIGPLKIAGSFYAIYKVTKTLIQ